MLTKIVPRTEIGNEDTPQSPLGRLIEGGTGLLIPLAQESDPLTDFESRQLSWRAAEPYIRDLETIKDSDTKRIINRDLLRFAILRLADLALIGHRVERRTPVRLSTIVRRINSQTASPDEAFTLLHCKARGSGHQSARVPGRPSYAKVLSVISGLAWHLRYETNRPQLILLATLLRCVYPPPFILHSRRRQRDAWRQLSDAIRKYRRNDDGEKDYQELRSAMAQALSARHLPS